MYDEAVPPWHLPMALVRRCFNRDWNCQNLKRKSTQNISCIPLILHGNSIFNKLLQKSVLLIKEKKAHPLPPDSASIGTLLPSDPLPSFSPFLSRSVFHSASIPPLPPTSGLRADHSK